MSPKFLLVATVKNEGPNILEWVAYHRAIGFNNIFVYQNDSIDETQKSLRTLAKIGAIEYFRNDCKRQQWQNKAYRRASFHPDYADADWAMALDGDEFLNVKIGDGLVSDLAAQFEEFDEIRMNWQNFGSSGLVDLSAELVTERYRLTDDPARIKEIPVGYKTLFKPRAFKRPGIHRPRVPLHEPIRTVNGSGIPWEDIPNPTWRSVDPDVRKFAQVNHYPIRDLSSFLIKTDRGSSSHVDRAVDQEYWERFDQNIVEETSILRHIPAVQEEMAKLNERSRGRLFMLRERGLEIWQERLAVLMSQPDIQGLRQSILDGRAA